MQKSVLQTSRNRHAGTTVFQTVERQSKSEQFLKWWHLGQRIRTWNEFSAATKVADSKCVEELAGHSDAIYAAVMQHVLIIHEVADYTAWKKIFDGAAEIRREAGERSYQVLKFHNEPNKIVHFSVWTSLADAKEFFESAKVVKIREEAGVKSPEFLYLEQLDAGIL